MSKRIARRVLVFCAAAGLTAASAQAQTTPCPSNFTGFSAAPVGKAVTCSCTPDQLHGGVWGTGRYSADSSICAAARHAGATGATGGTVTAYREASCPALPGSTRNGIVSHDWGAFDVTFAFSHPAPRCSPAVAQTGLEACPSSMRSHEARRTGDPLECSCPGEQAAGSVWGSGRYTFDSSVCAAARHAGAIGASGGDLLVFTAGSCQGFESSVRNGVTSSSWGAFQHSFAFTYPLPGCADGSQRR